MPRHAAARYAPAAARGGRYSTALSRTGSSAAASAARRATSLRLSSSRAAAFAAPASSAPNVWFCGRCGGRSARARRVRLAGAALASAVGTAGAPSSVRTRHGQLPWCASFSCGAKVLAACERRGHGATRARVSAHTVASAKRSVGRRHSRVRARAHLVAAFPRHGLRLAGERGAAVATRHRQLALLGRRMPTMARRCDSADRGGLRRPRLRVLPGFKRHQARQEAVAVGRLRAARQSCHASGRPTTCVEHNCVSGARSGGRRCGSARAHHARRRRAGRRTSAGGGSLGGLGLTGEGCDADTPPAPCKKSTARATSAAGVSCAQYAAAGGSACGGALMRATRRALRGGAAAEEAPVPQRRRHSPGASALRAGGLRCAARTRCWSERAAQWVPTVPARVDVQRTTLGCTAAGTLDVEGVARPRTWQRVRHRAEQHAASQVT